MSSQSFDTIDSTSAFPFYLWETPYTPPEPQQEVNTGIPLDSIFPCRPLPSPTPRQSLFVHHYLPAQHTELMARQDNTAPTGTFFLLVLLAALHFIYFKIRKLDVSSLLKALFSNRAMERVVRGSSHSAPRMAPIALLLAASLATALCLTYTPRTLTVLQTWLAACGALAFAYLLRNRLIRMLGKVYLDQEATDAYIINNYFYHLALSTLLIPLLLLTAYLPAGNSIAAYALYSTVGLCLLLRVARGLKLFLTQTKRPQFYLFYYLCAVETIPVIVLVRLFFLQ